MRPTLEHLPHELFGIPLFGVGWVLMLVLATLGIGILVGGKFRQAALQSIPFAAIVAVVVVFLLPNLEEPYVAPNGDRLRGIPIRGYGVLLFVATVAGVWLTQHRASQRGVDAGVIYSLATWVIALGLLGARLFYVIEYWQEFQSDTLLATAREIVNISQGGLVVYGGLIGAITGFAIFACLHWVPVLFLADLAVPGLLLGLAIGRLGCLLNGCCYGGVCTHTWAVQFPAASLVYEHQLATGAIRGFAWRLREQEGLRINSVIAGSPADEAGLKAGDIVTKVNSTSLAQDPEAALLQLGQSSARDALDPVTLTLEDSRQVRLDRQPLPKRSQPVHPTQVYSAVNALCICLLLLCAEPFLSRTGQLLALMLTIYPVTRFLLEIIRQDEMAFGPTSLTISQNISVLLLMVAGALWVFCGLKPKGIIVVQTQAERPPNPA